MCCGLGQRAIGSWLTQIGGKIPAQPLDRVGSQKTRKPDRAMGMLEHVESGPLHGEASQVDIGHGRVGVGGRVLGETAGPIQPQLGGLRRDRGLPDPGQLIGIGLRRVLTRCPRSSSSSRSMPPRCTAANRHAPAEKIGCRR